MLTHLCLVAFTTKAKFVTCDRDHMVHIQPGYNHYLNCGKKDLMTLNFPVGIISQLFQRAVTKISAGENEKQSNFSRTSVVFGIFV